MAGWAFASMSSMPPQRPKRLIHLISDSPERVTHLFPAS